MRLRQLLPLQSEVTLSDLLQTIDSAPPPLAPFSPVAIEFCDALSATLARNNSEARRADVAALSFWLRKASVLKMKQDWERTLAPGVSLRARGLTLHIAPTNVGSMFAYSWIVSLLMGNPNVIRLSARSLEAVQPFLTAIAQSGEAEAFAPLRERTWIITYGREPQITQNLSERAAVRMIWGGDQTVREIQSSAKGLHTRDVTFGDRFSFALLRRRAYEQLADAEKSTLARKFFNDVYFFDQQGCSSPRAVLWLGAGSSEDFYRRLNLEIEKQKHRTELTQVIAKLTAAQTSLYQEPARHWRAWSAELHVLEVPRLAAIDRGHCGSGFFFDVQIENLAELTDWLRPQDQTVAYFGFEKKELEALAVDRIVPIGRALEFDRYWDGYDLFAELSRQTRHW